MYRYLPLGQVIWTSPFSKYQCSLAPKMQLKMEKNSAILADSYLRGKKISRLLEPNWGSLIHSRKNSRNIIIKSFETINLNSQTTLFQKSLELCASSQIDRLDSNIPIAPSDFRMHSVWKCQFLSSRAKARSIIIDIFVLHNQN